MSKNILITGVSQGLGLAIAHAVLDQGWTVYGISRNRSRAFSELQEKYGSRVCFQSVDLSTVEDLNKCVFNKFLPLRTPIHAFINNAACAYDDLVTNIDVSQLRAMFEVNVFAPMLITKHVIRNMIFNKTKGVIVHISSISVHAGYKGLAMYAATKGAMEAFSKGTAREWGARGIRSNCIVAGFMETAMSKSISPEQREKIHRRTSLRRSTDIESVSAMAIHLVSDHSCAITGQNMVVDCGAI